MFVFWPRCDWIDGFDRCQDPQANVGKSIREAPRGIRDIIDDLNILASDIYTRRSEAKYQLLDSVLVDEVFESKPVGIAVFEFIIVG